MPKIQKKKQNWECTKIFFYRDLKEFSAGFGLELRQAAQALF